MATIAEGGLFPAIIDAYAPAYNLRDVLDASKGLTINYNISDFNSPSDIHGVHVSIVRQSNYKSLFNNETYPMGIYVQNVTVSIRNTSVTIPRDTFNCAQLSYNEYYKVQVRLSKNQDYDNETGAELSEYLTNESYLTDFSEWSTVCLIRFIAPSTLDMQGNGQILPFQRPLDISNLTLSGTYTKLDINTDPDNPIDARINNTEVNNGKNDKEYLSSFKVLLYDTNDDLKFDSGIINVDIEHNTSIYYQIPYYFESGNTYTLKVQYITANLYENEVEYSIQVSYSEKNNWSEQGLVGEDVGIDSVIGKVNISFTPLQTTQQERDGEMVDVPVPIPAGSQFIIRRGSDKDDFQYWETLWDKTLSTDMSTTFSFDDFTIESGVIYKYELTYIPVILPENVTGYRAVEGPILSIFDHAFLTGEGAQLSVKFNPNISTFKRNVSDNIMTTIGGKYPYIDRNSNMDYRTFTLSGTIAYEMDLEHQFTSRSDIYGEWIEVYGSYFVNRFINQQNDRVTQRKFRELVLDFLCDDMPKLFRSTPEGNILVRITDVNLTPNQQLSRMIYDFSCTATEIGEPSIENCKLYKIQNFD